MRSTATKTLFTFCGPRGNVDAAVRWSMWAFSAMQRDSITEARRQSKYREYQTRSNNVGLVGSFFNHYISGEGFTGLGVVIGQPLWGETVTNKYWKGAWYAPMPIRYLIPPNEPVTIDVYARLPSIIATMQGGKSRQVATRAHPSQMLVPQILTQMEFETYLGLIQPSYA